MSKKEEIPLIEPGKKEYTVDQGCDVRSVGRSSRSMRQAVACLVWEIFCNEMNWNTWNPRGYSVCATSAPSAQRQNSELKVFPTGLGQAFPSSVAS